MDDAMDGEIASSLALPAMTAYGRICHCERSEAISLR
jgi:hypothetical protein